MANYKEPDPEQYRFITLNFADLYPEDHPVSLLLATIRKLDLSEFDANYENDTGAGGRPAFPVDRMLSILFYSLLYGNISMREVEREVRQRADLMYLSGGMTLDHTTISVFRKRHEEAIKNLFAQVVFVGIQTGQVDLETVCIDGTKIKANANRQDIGTREELARRFKHVKEACKKRYEEWGRGGDATRKKKRLERHKEKLEAALEFMDKHPDRKRVHLNEPDADWQKSKTGYVAGYNAHVAVDSKSRMIVHTEVATSQADSNNTVSMVEGVEKIAAKGLPEKKCRTKYVLDSGYASENNLRSLEGRNLYMPDREHARLSGGKQKPEERDLKSLAEEMEPKSGLDFVYNKKKDSFTCPRGDRDLAYKRTALLSGIPYRLYRRHGCGSCPLVNTCTGGARRKEIHIREDSLDGLKVKRYPPKTKRRRKTVNNNPLTVGMREKLSTKEGRSVYALRFPCAEGTIGTLKAVRNGSKFLRTGLARVTVEWFERVIAHNLACLSGFSRERASPT